MVMVDPKFIENPNPFVRAAAVYMPEKAPLVVRAFEELDSLHNIPVVQEQEAMLRPVAEIFTIIPELIDHVTTDIHTITNYGIKARFLLRDDEKINDLLDQYEAIGKRIIDVGGKGVEFALSKLPPVFHGLDPEKGGHAFMSKRVANSGFDLHFKNVDYDLSTSVRRSIIDKAREAVNHIQDFAQHFPDQKLSEWLDSILNPDTLVLGHNQGKFNFMSQVYAGLFENSVNQLREMLQKGIDIKKLVPQSYRTQMDSRIRQLFQYGQNLFDAKPNSLKYFGADSYRLTAPKKDLLNEPPKRKT